FRIGLLYHTNTRDYGSANPQTPVKFDKVMDFPSYNEYVFTNDTNAKELYFYVQSQRTGSVDAYADITGNKIRFAEDYKLDSGSIFDVDDTQHEILYNYGFSSSATLEYFENAMAYRVFLKP